MAAFDRFHPPAREEARECASPGCDREPRPGARVCGSCDDGVCVRCREASADDGATICACCDAEDAADAFDRGSIDGSVEAFGPTWAAHRALVEKFLERARARRTA